MSIFETHQMHMAYMRNQNGANRLSTKYQVKRIEKTDIPELS